MPVSPTTSINPAELARAARLLALLTERGVPAPLFQSTRKGQRTIALLLKRTYKVENGACVLLPEEEQSPLCFQDVPYAEISPPRIAPIFAADEGFAFRPMTDVVIQACAYTYAPGVSRTTASVRFGKVEREIVVVGNRRGEHDALGRPRFSEPEPFELMPIRWDRAYGGFDAAALAKNGTPLLDEMKRLRPEHDFGRTPYHYPRNPCGRGYLVEMTRDSFEGLSIPNLEHPFAPLSPKSLAVDGELRWMKGPLPAAWDFVGDDWFPRCAYLGMPPAFEPEEGVIPGEIKRGWAAEDLMSIPSLLHLSGPDDVRLEYAQAAAPGMSFPRVAPDERFVFSNMHRHKPVHTIDLPGEVPQATIELSPGKPTEMTPHLSTVVFRVDLGEVEMLWSARAEAPLGLTADELLAARRTVRWNRPAEGK
jgi:hypothetical protein